MKFSQQLEEYKIELWKDHYIPYAALKKKLDEIKLQMQLLADLASRPSSATNSSQQSSLLLSPSLVSKPSALSLERSSSPPASPSGSMLGSLRRKRAGSDACIEGDGEEAWCLLLGQHAKHAGEFVEKGVQGLRTQLEKLSQLGDKFVDECCAEDGKHLEELRFLEALGRVKEGLSQLKAFAEINHAALYKILKKHDKVLSLTNGIKIVFPRLVAQSKLDDMEPFDELDNEVQRLSLLTSQCEGLNAPLEVANLAAGLGRSMQAGSIASPLQTRSDNILFFFLGSTAALSLSIIVFIALPPIDPETFDVAYFLSPFPVFEVILAVLLTLWGLGFVTRACDDKNINYKFLLAIDPRARVQPNFFFARAAALTSCWIFVFGMYVLDYKWMIFPTVFSSRGYNERSSLHFVLYPAFLVLVAVLVVFGPSKTCRCRYWSEFVKSLGRTAGAPFYAVSFLDNLVGDVLTSLAKPLQIVPSAVCYFLSPHPQTTHSVARFKEHGNLCPKWEHSFVNPFIAAMPFVFRALQCLRRYYDTRDVPTTCGKNVKNKHLWNFGKYTASLLVVFISGFVGDSPTAVVCVSGFATIYAATWDIGLDWGLTFHDLLSCGRKIPESNSSSNLQRSSAQMEDGSAKIERHFLPRSYWLAAVFDILARLSWLQTLMPADILTDNIIVRESLIVGTLALEIFRRSVWAVLRIEYEQVSNASGFRTLLWVPSKLNAAATLPNLELLPTIDRQCHTVFEGTSSASIAEAIVGSSSSLAQPPDSAGVSRQPLLVDP